MGYMEKTATPTNQPVSTPTTPVVKVHSIAIRAFQPVQYAPNGINEGSATRTCSRCPWDVVRGFRG